MSEHERLTDDDLATLIMDFDGPRVGTGMCEDALVCLRELQALRRVAHIVTTDERGDTVSVERVPDADAQKRIADLEAENARLRAMLARIGERAAEFGISPRASDVSLDSALAELSMISMAAREALEGSE